MRSALFALLLTTLAGCDLRPAGADPVTKQGDSIFSLFAIMMILSGLVLLLVVALLVYMLFRFRERPGAGPASEREGNNRLEIAWTVAPAALLVVLFILTMRTMLDVDDPPSDQLRVTVVGHQWWWEYRFPGQRVVTADELHLPIDTPITLELTSDDVIHDFWAPQFGWKQDNTPGKTTTMAVRIDQPGVYDGACAEFCGAQHAWMRFRVVAQTPADFNAWLQHEAQPATAPAGDLEQRGQQLFLQNTCVNCHTIAGTEAQGDVGPNLTHFGSRATIGSGVVANTQENLVDWIRDPKAIKPGVLMPGYNLSDADLQALAAYLEGLK